MGRSPPYKIKRIPLADNPAKTTGTEASHTVPEALTPGATILPAHRVIPPGMRIATTMEIRSQIADIMNNRNYHPIRELVDMVQAQKQMLDETGKPLLDANGSPRMQFVYDAEFRKSVHAELAPYIAPKLKAVDMQVAQSAEITITVVRFGDREKNDPKQVNERVVDV